MRSEMMEWSPQPWNVILLYSLISNFKFTDNICSKWRNGKYICRNTKWAIMPILPTLWVCEKQERQVIINIGNLIDFGDSPSISTGSSSFAIVSSSFSGCALASASSSLSSSSSSFLRTHENTIAKAIICETVEYCTPNKYSYVILFSQ